RDLEAITLHCLEKEPTRRYPSALALAEDLQRFREGRQVAARPVGAAARLARACRRRPLVALLLGLLTASLFGGLAGVTWKVPEGLLTLDRVSGTIARLRDPTGTVRVDVPVPADHAVFKVGLSPDLKRLAIVWRSPGGFSAGVYDFSGREQARVPELHRADVW